MERVRICDLWVGDEFFMTDFKYLVVAKKQGRILYKREASKIESLGENSKRWVDRFDRKPPKLHIVKEKEIRPVAEYSNNGHINTLKKYGDSNI